MYVLYDVLYMNYRCIIHMVCIHYIRITHLYILYMYYIPAPKERIHEYGQADS